MLFGLLDLHVLNDHLVDFGREHAKEDLQASIYPCRGRI